MTARRILVLTIVALLVSIAGVYVEHEQSVGEFEDMVRSYEEAHARGETLFDCGQVNWPGIDKLTLDQCERITTLYQLERGVMPPILSAEMMRRMRGDRQ